MTCIVLAYSVKQQSFHMEQVYLWPQRCRGLLAVNQGSYTKWGITTFEHPHQIKDHYILVQRLSIWNLRIQNLISNI